MGIECCLSGAAMLNAQKIGGGRPERGLSCEDLEVRIRVREGCSVRADPILGMWGQGRFQSPIERAVELVWGGSIIRITTS